MMTGVEITMMLCKHYTPNGCMCPARRLKWWKPERWLLGPIPLCVFDHPLDIREQKLEGKLIICRYQEPLEGQPS